jgi:hypothetical protein
VAASAFKVPRLHKNIGEPGNNKRPARPTSGGCVARRSPMWAGSWLAYGEIRRNSAHGAARFSRKVIMSPDAVRIAITDKGLWTGITSKGVTTGTTARGLTESTAPGLTTMTTNREDSRDKLPRAKGEDADLQPREFDLGSEQSVFVMLQAPSAELIAGQTRAPALQRSRRRSPPNRTRT